MFFFIFSIYEDTIGRPFGPCKVHFGLDFSLDSRAVLKIHEGFAIPMKELGEVILTLALRV